MKMWMKKRFGGFHNYQHKELRGMLTAKMALVQGINEQRAIKNVLGPFLVDIGKCMILKDACLAFYKVIITI